MKGFLLALCILQLVVSWNTVCGFRFQPKFPKMVKSMVIKSKEVTRQETAVLRQRLIEEKVFSEVLKIGHGLAGQDDGSGHCSCKNATCGCCLHMTVPKIHLHGTVCLNVSYLREETGLQVALVLDGKIIIEKKVTAKNPPPICANIPHLKLARLCLRLYNLQIAKKSFAGCAKIEAQLKHITAKKFDLGCFHIP